MASLAGVAGFLSGFLRAKYLAWRLKSADQLRHYQARKLANFLASIAKNFPIFTPYKNADLSHWPLMDKATLMGNFADYNRLKISADQGWDFLKNCGALKGYFLGCSTGTSGNRGLYLVSDFERHYWLGVMMARVLPPTIKLGDRLAILLPIQSTLYKAAQKSKLLNIAFFDSTLPVAEYGPAIKDFSPDFLVAAPHGLSALIDAQIGISPRHIISGAEVLDPKDKTQFKSYFNCPIDEIYMATEGLLATSCRHGSLHMQDDFLLVEYEPFEDGLVSPIITDFSRHTQAMVRYRLNDLLRLDHTPCTCGSPRQRVKEIVGRMDDCLWLNAEKGPIRLTPDSMRNVIIDTDRTIEDFRISQIDLGQIEVTIKASADVRAEVKLALEALAARHGGTAIFNVVMADKLERPTGKLRRIKHKRLDNPAN